jgi:tripartite-type tricarboxylate transporter receptor subunit TctC
MEVSMSKSPSRRAVLAAGLAGVLAPSLARAQSWPSRPVAVVVPYPAGGGADTVSRILFQRLAAELGQTFIIENRGGASGTLGANAVAVAPADGHTILYDATAHSANPALLPRMPYDTLTAFRPVFLAAIVPNLLVSHPSVRERTVADILAAARARPGSLDWASSGNGSAQHLALELFRTMASVNVNHVPYRGGGPALADVMAGHVPFFFANASSGIAHVRSGALRAIAHTSRGRIGILPELPAVADTIPGYEALEWNGVFLPAATPDAIAERLNGVLNRVIQEPAIVERLTSLSVGTRPNTPSEFGTFVRAEIEKWGALIRANNIRLE